jgi:hypothetical protein
MPKPRSTPLYPLEPHTKAKREILRRYLGAWLPVLSRSKSGFYYVDGRCGPGRYAGGEHGSPIIALKVAASQAEYLTGPASFLFIDGDANRVANLKAEIAKLTLPPNFTVQCICGEFDEVFPPIFENRQQSGRQRPTFAVFDPFGFKSVPFAFVQRMLRQESCEVMIDFMAERSRLSDLRKLYFEQLRTVATFVRQFEIRDKQNKSKYGFFFASNDRFGHLTMKEAVSSVDPMGELVASDRTVPRQFAVLGGDTHSMAKLKTLLRERFFSVGQLNTTDVRGFVEDETPYLKKHMDAALDEEEKAGNLQAQSEKVDGTRRNRGNFADGVMVEFGASTTDQLKLKLF